MTPRRLLLTGLLGTCLLQGLAQATPTAEQDAAQQFALQAQRAQVLSRYRDEQVACLRRFFVNDCLDATRRREREALAAIDSELQAIALRARQRAAEAELRKVQANLAAARAAQPDSAQTERASAARRAALAQREEQAAARARQAAAQAAASGEATGRPQAAPAVSPRHCAPLPPVAPSSGQRAEQAAKARTEYAAKQKAYAEKQAQQARRNAAQKQAPPLPVPPPSGPLR